MSDHKDLEIGEVSEREAYPISTAIKVPSEHNPAFEVTVIGLLLNESDPGVLARKVKEAIDILKADPFVSPNWPGRFIPNNIELTVRATIKTAWSYTKQEAEAMGWVDDGTGRYRRPY